MATPQNEKLLKSIDGTLKEILREMRRNKPPDVKPLTRKGDMPER